MHVLLHEVLPYSRLGVLQNQFVVSPPLALVATAPAVRVYCEEHAPYALGGTWWLAHVTTHCVVRCCIASSGGAEAEKSSETAAVPCVLDGEEKVFSCTRPSLHRGNTADSNDDGIASSLRTKRPGGSRDEQKRRCDWEQLCWVPEESFLLARERRRLLARRSRKEDYGKGMSSATAAAAAAAAEEPFIARNSGTTALLPPHLSSNRRLLSFVRGAPASFLGFCSLAAQHGWHHAARTLLQRVTSKDADATDREGGVMQQQNIEKKAVVEMRGGVGPARLYVVYTQLYAICDCPESRVAYSMWWCLRRMASAMGPASLSPALHVLSRERRLVYRPGCFPTGSVPTDIPPVQKGTHSRDNSNNGSVTTTPTALHDCDLKQDTLLRYRSYQQASSLRAALRYTDEHDSNSLTQSLTHTRSADFSYTESSAHHLGERMGMMSPNAWMVTNACSLIVSGDITLWSGVSTVDSHQLLQRHWYPFAQQVLDSSSDVSSTKSSRGSDIAACCHGTNSREGGGLSDLERSADIGAAALVPSHQIAYRTTASLPPPCALFLYGNVILAVEHKLHRDAVNARGTTISSSSSPRKRASNTTTTTTRAGSHDELQGAKLCLLHEHSTEEEEGEEEVADVQPLFADMGDDEESDGSVAASSGLHSNRTAHSPAPLCEATTRGEADGASASCLWYDPHEERFLHEIAHRQAFSLLHCVDVTYLRLPLGQELVAERPKEPRRCTASNPHERSPRLNDRCGDHDDRDKGVALAAAAATDVWDARWLSCLFPRVQVLDVEGPPSFTHASSSSWSSSAGVLLPGSGGTGGKPMASRAAAVTVARHYRQMVRPRELAFSLGAAAAANTLTLPLYTMSGLWCLPELRHVVLRAYPFEVLPSFVGGAGAGTAVQPTMQLSVMGWPYVSADGLRPLLSASNVVDAAAVQRVISPSVEAGSVPATPLGFSMLSFSHMDSLAFVDALLAVFPSPLIPSSPSPTLPLTQLHQLELSKTRITTAVLAQMNLPLRTPQLRVLRLSSTPVDSVTSLVGLQTLVVLNLASTRVTPHGLRYVQWMPALEELFLTQCECLCDDGTAVEADGEGMNGERGNTTDPASQSTSRSRFSNVFSLGVATARLDGNNNSSSSKGNNSNSGQALERGVGELLWASQQTFPMLRVLDLSNNPQLTEQALSYTMVDGALPVHVARFYPGSTSPVSDLRSTTSQSERGSGSTRHTRAHDNPATPTFVTREDAATAPMPQVETLFLMHTSVSQLACLLALCPRLRTLDVSFTPLREDGLWALVRCPRQLPFEHLIDEDNKTQRDEAPVEGGLAGPVYTVQFPQRLRLQQLNLSGTPLACLHPLSCAPPLDWSYTTLDVAGRLNVSAASKTRNVSEHRKKNRTPRREERTCATPHASNGDVVEEPAVRQGSGLSTARDAPPTALLLYGHPAVLDDFSFDVHLRTQQAWRQHKHSKYDCKTCSPSSPVHVAAASGYTIGVDAAWWAARSARMRLCTTGHDDASAIDEFNTFDAATQWAGVALADPAPLTNANAASHAVASSHDGGIVRYGVLQPWSLRQLRLGYSGITASGLAAGYSIPQLHTAEGGMQGGLVELSLRGAASLCPPHPHLHQGRGGDEVPAMAAAMPQHEGHPLHGAAALLPPPAAAAQEGGHHPPLPEVAPARPSRQTVPAALHWTDAEALCAVLRLHSESLCFVDLSHTSVSLSTFFKCVYAEPTRVGSRAGKGLHHGDTAPLHWAVGSQWEDVLTQGSMDDAAPALCALLRDPSSVLDSLVQPSAITRNGPAAVAADNPDVPHPLFSRHQRLCTVRCRRRTTPAAGIFTLEQLRRLDVEDTPLGAALKRLFPRLYHCVRGVDNDDGKSVVQDQRVRAVDVSGEAALTDRPHVTVPSSEAATEGQSSAEEEADDGASSTASSAATDDPHMPASQHRRRGTLRMRSLWEDLLHKLFGRDCLVLY
jgi:hypothetical protein